MTRSLQVAALLAAVAITACGDRYPDYPFPPGMEPYNPNPAPPGALVTYPLHASEQLATDTPVLPGASFLLNLTGPLHQDGLMAHSSEPEIAALSLARKCSCRSSHEEGDRGEIVTARPVDPDKPCDKNETRSCWNSPSTSA